MSGTDPKRRGWRRFTNDGPLLPPEEPWEEPLRQLESRLEFERWHPRRTQ